MLKNHICIGVFLSVVVFPLQSQSLRDTTLQADYVIICTSENVPRADRLAQFRRSHNGLKATVAAAESVYASFPFSNAPDSSLRSFIMYATRLWRAPSPRFFVLAGNVNTVPSHKEPGLQIPPAIHEDSILVDRWFVDSEGASPTQSRYVASIGRLPAWTAQQLDTIISKTIAYEQVESGSWMRRSLTLADYNTIDGDFFESCAANLQSWMNQTWFDTTMVHVRASSPQYQNLSGFLTDWRQGAAFVSLVGHANPWIFSYSRYLTAFDLQALGNGTKLPICFFVGCSQAFYRTDSVSIVERLLFQQGGGAIATVASTGEIFVMDAMPFFQALVSNLSAISSMSLGEAFMLAQNSASVDYSGSTARRITLLGDPALVPKRILTSTGIVFTASHPTELSLAQNYPNPFNSTTRFVFSVPQPGRIVVEVYSVLGACVATIFDHECAIGVYSVAFSGSTLPSGVYVARLRSGDRIKSCKIMLIK